jgi:hypothetical protein
MPLRQCPKRRSIIQWTPSCKPGKVRFVYEGHVEDVRVFRATLNLPDSHKKKMLKVTTNDFEDDIGHPRGRVRYAGLRIASSDVNIRWVWRVEDAIRAKATESQRLENCWLIRRHAVRIKQESVTRYLGQL